MMFRVLQFLGAALIAVMLSWVFFILLFSLEV